MDDGGLIRSGPQSSGAVPGPACYDRGGNEPTTTDAAFYLGMLGEGKLASGLQLSKSLAENALNAVGGKINLSACQKLITRHLLSGKKKGDEHVR